MKPLRVKDVHEAAGTVALLVNESNSLEEVLRRFSQEAALRGIFVTDDSGRLAGVITRRDLLDWIRLRLGTALQGPLTQDGIMRLAHLVRVGTARDAIHPGGEEVSIRPDDPLDQALQIMLDSDIIALPVIDDEGRILGDLTLSDVLRHLLGPPGAHGQQASRQST